MRLPIAELEEKIGYEFKDKNLLKQAFVHSSYGRMKGIQDNERMEYLGDSVLQLVVTEWQYLRDGSDEGKMTSDRQKLVCEDTLLAEVHELGLEKYLLYSGKKTVSLTPFFLAYSAANVSTPQAPPDTISSQSFRYFPIFSSLISLEPTIPILIKAPKQDFVYLY